MNEGVVISKRLVLVNSASSILARLISVSVLVWLHQYLLKRISAEEYSVYPVVAAVVAFVPLLTRVLTAGVARYVVEAYAKRDDERVTEIVSSMFPPLLGAGLVLLVGGWLFAANVEHVLTIPPGLAFDACVMMGLMMTLAALTAVLTPFTCGLYVKQMFVLDNVIQLGTELLRLGLLCALLFGVSTRVMWVVVATFGAQAARLGVMQLLSRHYVPAIRFRFDAIQWRRFRELTSFGVWSFVSQVADLLRVQTHPIVLNKLAAPLDVTCYFLGSLVLQQIQSVAILASSPLQPVLTAFHATGSKERLRNAYLRGGRYALWLVMFAVTPMIVFAPEIIQLYVGKEFHEAATVMRLLLLVMPIGYGNIMMGKIAHATANLGVVSRRMIAAQIGMVLLTLYLVGVQGMGATGSSLAVLVIASILHPFFMWPLGLQMTDTRASSAITEILIRGLVPSAAGLCIWLYAKYTVNVMDWWTMGMAVGCGWLVYLYVLYRFCMRDYEYQELNRFLKSVFKQRPIAAKPSLPN